MTVAAFVVSVLALVASLGAVAFTRRAAHAADRQAAEARRQADAADEELRVAATPHLVVALLDTSSSTGSDLLYEIRNDGPQDLDSIVVRRPETADLVRYPLAKLGGSNFEDEIDVGPLQLGGTAKFLLKIGATPNPPECRVRITCVAGARSWDLSRLLEPRPRPNRMWAF